MENIRVRFAPSPTGALHIGGIRTALYNYLLAKKYGGTFILRIEDTDQTRFVPGAEDYIIEALHWAGIVPGEGQSFGGEYGPYRQSDRKAIYQEYAKKLVENGQGYYAFDTAEELDAARQADDTFKYDYKSRVRLNNSLNLSAAEVQQRLDSGIPYVIRLKVPEGETVHIQDMVRGEVNFQSNELDDKVMLKGDGMPTYHLANVVDDRLMKITHVIRGEEWLPSTAHHVLLYRAFGWEAEMPRFAHLPLILKPDGKGKLSKRDGTRLGIPVFPLSWKGETPEDSFVGFREAGFDPRAMVNFMAFMGWNPGTEQEIFSMNELAEAFSVEKIGKSGARFDIEKARWFNQQYIMASSEEELAKTVRPIIEAQGHRPTEAYLRSFVGMMKERVVLFSDFWTNGAYFFEDFAVFDEVTIRKKWKANDSRATFIPLLEQLDALIDYNSSAVQACVEGFTNSAGLKFGDVLPILRVGLTGTMKGPAVFDMMALLGKAECRRRMERAFDLFDQVS
ncbi:MAG: glutamate--tRNA ligase [Haliscomenobacter sp.]|uniref:glutamate--tRNA ligase n=1 Tax=Haliscomenobacter sp. TaxID=2717303 RepID=UPI0029ABE286|nr:glutamate--tRNA ligase [Haliscomenobacter sp.]MDX2069528.1 glutamate--tRNA ligase [Haliscomenobacter sp.]